MKMKIKTSELIGAQLDWAVAKCEGRVFKAFDSFLAYHDEGEMNYSTDWAQGGPIIEREQILFVGADDRYHAWVSNRTKLDTSYASPTHLIAAMRCYVASKLGDEDDEDD